MWPAIALDCKSSFVAGFDYLVFQGIKKPYNPILGETFRCCWFHPQTNSHTFYIAEQVSCCLDAQLLQTPACLHLHAQKRTTHLTLGEEPGALCKQAEQNLGQTGCWSFFFADLQKLCGAWWALKTRTADLPYMTPVSSIKTFPMGFCPTVFLLLIKWELCCLC